MTAARRGGGVPVHAGVHFPPPLLFVAGLAAGVLLHRIVPLPLLPSGWRAAALPCGWSLIGASVILSAWALFSFARARTPVMPNRPVRALVTTGPYRYSRNPMYVSVSLLAVGVGLLVNTAWIPLVLPIVWASLHVLVIRKEERYLAATFGEAYEAYRARVRRWI